MNAAHLHLICTHLPVAGTVCGIGLLGWALARHHEALKRTGLGLFVIAAVMTVPAYFSGGPAALLIKGLPGVRSEFVEQHLEVANVAFAGVGVSGAGAVAALVGFRRKAAPAWVHGLLLALALVAGGLLGWAGNLGGKIRHTEIRYENRYD